MLSAVLGGVTYHGGADPNTVRLGDWFGLASRVDSLHESLKIGIIGKYTGLTDRYYFFLIKDFYFLSSSILYSYLL